MSTNVVFFDADLEASFIVEDSIRPGASKRGQASVDVHSLLFGASLLRFFSPAADAERNAVANLEDLITSKNTLYPSIYAMVVV